MSKEESKKTKTNKEKNNKKINNKDNKSKVNKKDTKEKDKKKEIFSKKEQKKEITKEVKTNEKIKEIEEKTKKIPKQKIKKEKLINFAIELDEKRKIIYGFVGGLLLGLLIMVLFTPKRIATLKDGTQSIVKIDKTNITADDLYTTMKDRYSISYLLDEIDNIMLTKIYPENDEMLEEINSNAKYYLNLYNQYYGYSEEEFLESNGFNNYNEFLEYLKLDYRRKQAKDKYVEKSITDKEIQKYYDENVFGDINCQHILVSISEDEENGLTESEAKSLAEEIITKLKDGTSWEDVQKEYKDKVTYEDLGYQSWDASLEESFLTALKDMDENSYSKEPVKTSYGYHVIYKLDQKEAPKLDSVKDSIVKKLVAEKEKEDSTLQNKALIALREEHNLTFSDTDFKSEYEDYCKENK